MNQEEFLEDGWVDNKQPPINLELTKKEVDLIIHCINTNATTKADVKENLLNRIRNGI